MDDNKLQYVQHSTCQCRCPCHNQKNKDSPSQSRPPPPRPPPPTEIQSSSRMAQITFSETFQINNNDSEPDQRVPFRVKAASPAVAAFSKSFLHVKNMVKNMTARWESLAEPTDDDYEEDSAEQQPKRTSFERRCVGPTCARTDNMQLNWKRVPVGKGDQTQYQWRHNSSVPENIENHEYSLEPLENNRNFSTHNNDPYADTAQNQQTFQIHTPTLHAVENSFQDEISSNFVDTASRNLSHITEIEESTSGNKTILSNRSIGTKGDHSRSAHSKNSGNSRSLPPTTPENARSFHSTNSEDTRSSSKNHFKSTNTIGSEENRSQNMKDLEQINFENTFKWDEDTTKPPPLPPHSIRSEVKNIRKPFEQDVDEIVQQVKRASIDAHEHRRHSADNTPGMSELQHWLHDIPFADELQISHAKSINSIENKKSEGNTKQTSNNGGCSKWNENDDNNVRTEIVSSHAATNTPPTKCSMIGTIHPSFDKKEDNDNSLGKVEAVKTTLSSDWENAKAFSLGRKSLDDYPSTSFKSPTATGSRDEHEGSKKRLSAPPNITSQPCQRSKNTMRENYDEGVVQKSNQSAVPQNNVKSNVAIQTSLTRIHTNAPSTQSKVACETCSVQVKPSDINRELHNDQCNTKSIDLIRTKSKINVQPSHTSSKLQTSRNLDGSIKIIKSNDGSARRKIPTRENEDSLRNRNGENKTLLDEIAKFATGTSEENELAYNTYMAVISVQDGCEPYKNNNQVSRRNFRQDNSANVNEAIDNVRPTTAEPEEKETFLNTLSKEYDELVATPSQLLVEPICHTVSITNTSVKMQKRNEGGGSSWSYQKGHASAQMTAETRMPTSKSQSSSGKGKGSTNSSQKGMHRSKREFYKCQKCLKIVSSGEAAFNSTGGIDMAWHPRCFKCLTCDKDLSQVDHSFFDGEPYCLEHYVRVANIPKCSKCQQLIFDSTYTSAAGSSWHQNHFTCASCEKPLVDTKYVFVRNKHPYCFHCHEKHFPKQCRTCLGRISPQEPYVQGGNVFWHSNSTCLHCSSCNGSLVGRSLFFRRGCYLYCNRYCALREM